MEIELRRRFFAEELEAVCKLRTPALVVHSRGCRAIVSSTRSVDGAVGWRRELRWVRGGADAPHHEIRLGCHGIAVAIGTERQLFSQ
jgi:hypothetical protein